MINSRPVPRSERSEDQTRINHRIRVPEVLLIDENGNQVGRTSTQVALEMAKDRGLDLVEISPTARPPVCKLMDYGKLKYEKKRKEKENKKKSSSSSMKEIQIRVTIEDHDLEVKCRKADEFLVDRDKVRVVVIFQGREMMYARQQGAELMEKMKGLLKTPFTVESASKLEGKRMYTVFGPAR